MFDFDHPASRKHDGSIKYSVCQKQENLLPMWVADMDFEVQPVILKAMKERLEIPFFGYTAPSAEYKKAVCDWMKARHDVDIDPEWIVEVPGIVPALKMLIQALTRPGDQILIFPPVYFPFKSSIEINNRTLVECPLIEEDHTYRMNFDLLEKQLKEHDVKMIIFCSPHNPTGNVWPKEDLEHLCRLCKEHHILLVSDEIHMDFARPEIFTSMLKPGSEMADQLIVCTAPSKTFNLAALDVSNLIIPDVKIRDAVHETMERNGMGHPNLMGLTACQAAYENGAQWLDELLEYLDGNKKYVKTYLEENLPEIRMFDCDGLYLFWLDFRKLGLIDDQLQNFLQNEAGLYLNSGVSFGQEGSGFARLNAACPRGTLQEAMQRLRKAVEARNA